MLKNLSATYCAFPDADIATFRQKLDSANQILLLAHSNADADTLSSCAAMQLVIANMGKKSVIVCPDEPKTVDLKINYLVGRCPFTPDLIISLDTATQERAYTHPEAANIFWINIDHHISNTLYGNLNMIDGKAASACEVLAMVLVKAYGANVITPPVAQRLLYGLLDDSQSFRTSNVSADTLIAAAYLDSLGGNLRKTKQELVSANKISAEQFAKWQKVLAYAKYLFEGQVVVIPVDMDVREELNVEAEDLNGLINHIANIMKTDLVLFIFEIEPGIFKISTRSVAFDASSFCKHFGGGGHFNAAGAKVERENLQMIIDEAIAYIKKQV